MSLIFDTLPTSVCLPPLWAHRRRQIVWQSNVIGLAIPSWLCLLKPNLVTWYFGHTTSFFFIGRESRGPICVSSKTASLAGGVGSCNHQQRRDEVFVVEETVVACKPFRPPRPCLPPQSVDIALKCYVL